MNRRPRLYMLCGVPASGKSTWVKNLGINEDNDNIYIASTDKLIEMSAFINNKTYDEIFAEQIGPAEKTMYTFLTHAVKKEKDIIWDQTNLNFKSRAKKLIMIPDYYEKIAVYFPIPFDIKQRLASRPGKNIPWNVVQSMIRSFEVPSESEGFDRICHAIKEECYV